MTARPPPCAPPPSPSPCSPTRWPAASGSPPSAVTPPPLESYADPFDTLTTALDSIPLQVAQPCLHLEAGTYSDSPVLARPATVLGDSITGCRMLPASGADAALTLGPGSGGSRIRRLSLSGATGTLDPILQGLWIYGADDVEISNCLLTGNNGGIRVEESHSVRLRHNTVVHSRVDAVTGSFLDAALSSNLFQDNGECDVFSGANDPNRAVVSDYDHLGNLPLCGGALPGPHEHTGSPILLDARYWFLDPASSANLALSLVDGADPDLGPDIDQSPGDRGAYGGPWGELHASAQSVPTHPGWLVVVALAAVALGIWLRDRGGSFRPHRSSRARKATS